MDGTVLVSAMHITSGVYVNDWEDGLIDDFQEWLEKLAPAGLDYRHHRTGEDNADAHLKRTIMGHQVVLPITAGKLDLGPWEQVFYAEFDGRRRKRVVDEGDGRVSSRAYPERPFVGVGAVIVDQGRVVLIKRRFEPLAGQWSLPGGAVDVGETLVECVAREMLEETGLVVEVGPVVEVFDRIIRDGDGRVQFHYVLVDYLCRPTGGSLQAGSDVAEAVYAEPDDLARFALADPATAVIRRALGMAGGAAASSPPPWHPQTRLGPRVPILGHLGGDITSSSRWPSKSSDSAARPSRPGSPC